VYRFKPYTDRIWKMRERIRDRVIQGDAEKAVLRMEAAELYKNVVPIIRKPLVTKYVAERMTLLVEDDDYFVGN
jgi:hypothetical protein